ncbi:MAG TPA: type IV pilus assembly protein PilM [Solirubrobacterales bacterium]|nr:type IV pilus assembly protein PilM [Solirubrobacterales bacterium]
MLQLKRQKKTAGVVGLDIEAGSIAATEIDGSGQVTATAIEPLPPGAFSEGEVADADGLSQALKSLFGQHKLSKRVRVGIGNQRVVVRTLRLPVIEDPKEMEAAVRFQAQEQMPMPLDQAVLEHQVVGGVAAEEGSTPQVDVVVVAARRDMVGSFVGVLRGAGLEPIGVDLSAFGMIRALAGADVPGLLEGGDGTDPGGTARPDQAVLYCNLGDVMNLAVARGRSCLFTRVSMLGMEAIANRFAAERGLAPELAMQWLSYVGLERPPEEIEGDGETVLAARRVLEEDVPSLVDELRLSLDYYAAQESAVPVGQIVLCGTGSAIPGLLQQMEAGIGLSMGVVQPAALASYGVHAARLTLPYGIALES